MVKLILKNAKYPKSLTFFIPYPIDMPFVRINGVVSTGGIASSSITIFLYHRLRVLVCSLSGYPGPKPDLHRTGPGSDLHGYLA